MDPIVTSEAYLKLEEACYRVYDANLVNFINVTEDNMARGRAKDFEEFYTKYRQLLRKGECEKAWKSDEYYISYQNPLTKLETEICFDCFLDGSSLKNAVICIGNNSKCECGNSIQSMRTTCEKHSGSCDHPEEELDLQLRMIIISAIATLFRNIRFYARFDENSFLLIVKWVQRLVFLGDSVRRCIIIGMARYVNIIEFIKMTTNLSKETFSSTFMLLVSLAVDQKFREWIGPEIVMKWPELVKFHFKIASTVTQTRAFNISNVMIFYSLVFGHPDAPQLARGIDLCDVVASTLEVIVSYALENPSLSFVRHSSLNRVFGYLKNMLNWYLDGATDEQCAVMMNRVVDILSPREISLVVVRERPATDASNVLYASMYLFVLNLIWAFKKLAKRCSSFVNLYPLEILVEELKNTKLFSENACLLDFYVGFTQMYSLHLLVFLSIDREKFVDICKRVCDDTDWLFRRWMLVPLRWFFACEMIVMDAFPGFHPKFRETLETAYNDSYDTNTRQHFNIFFSLIQTLLMHTSNKEEGLRMIAWIVGVFWKEEKIDTNEKRVLVISFIRFVGCLVYDRSIITHDKATQMRMRLMTLVASKDLQVLSELKNLFQTVYKEQFFIDEVKTYLKIGKDRTLQIADYSLWHPFIPNISIEKMMEAVHTTFAAKHRSRLLPVAPLELQEFLISPTMLAAYYWLVSDRKCERYYQLLVAELMSAALGFHQEENPDGPRRDVIVVETMLDLVSALEGFSIQRFLHQKIQLVCRPVASIGSILAEEFPELKLGESLSPQKKERGKHFIMRNILIQQEEFDSHLGQLKHFRKTEGCCICSAEREGPLVYPIMTYTTVLPSVARHRLRKTTPEPGNLEETYGISICPHRIHQSCWSEELSECPVCKSRVNGFLPIMETGYDPVDDSDMVCSILLFMKLFSEEDDLRTIVRAFCAQIESLEMHHRLNPTAIQDNLASILLRNFFLCLWFFRILCDETEPSDSESPLDSLVITLLRTTSHEIDKSLVKALLSSVSDSQERYATLRCIALFEHFALDRKLSDSHIIDWDELLSCDFLYNHFEMDEIPESVLLPALPLIDLPDDFCELLKKCSINLNCEDRSSYICLLTKEILCISESDTSCTELKNFVRQNMRSSFSVFMQLAGANPLRVCLVYRDSVIDLEPLYTDPYGFTDIRNESRFPVRLSPTRVAELAERLLSGSWLQYVI